MEILFLNCLFVEFLTWRQQATCIMQHQFNFLQPQDQRGKFLHRGMKIRSIARNACKESQLLSDELDCLDRCSVAVGGHSVKICRICF